MASAVGERIRLRRQELGLRQEDLAARVGASPSAVLAWEKGRYFPSRHQGALEAVLGFRLTEPEPDPEPDPELERLLDLGEDRGGYMNAKELQIVLDAHKLSRRRRAG